MLVRAICCDPHALFRRKVPKVGVEPTRPCGHWILSPARLPFRHFGISHNNLRGESLPMTYRNQQVHRLEIP